MPEKRTTVRELSWPGRAVRLATRVGLAVLPQAVHAHAAHRFLSPRRAWELVAPEVPGMRGVRGAVRTGACDVVLWSFGRGPPVLLVHGWEGRAAQLSAFIPPIVAAGHRAVAVDMPAHGAASGRSTSLVEFARALHDIAHVVGHPAGLIAHSFGGAAALLAAADEPFTDAIALVAPASDPYFFADRAAEWLGIPLRHRRALYQQIEMQVGRSFAEVALRNKAGRIDLPLLVLHDPRDAEVPVEQGRVAAAVSTRGQFEAVHGVGHRRILREPSVVTRAVDFVTGEEDARVAADAPLPRIGYERRSGSA
jgi:pimeloyl-ACP methyl ester carboxylesterase